MESPRPGLRRLNRAICSETESLRRERPAFPECLHDSHLLSEQPWHILQSEHGCLRILVISDTQISLGIMHSVYSAFLLCQIPISRGPVTSGISPQMEADRRGIRMDRGIVTETQLLGLTLSGRGKVRDIYDLGESLLIVCTDRISAFDVILPDPIPDKGRVLEQA